VAKASSDARFEEWGCPSREFAKRRERLAKPAHRGGGVACSAHRVLEVVAERCEEEDQTLTVGEAPENAGEVGEMEDRLKSSKN
jgi:hypothetical protein